jgi:hypothetical protein
VDRGSHLSPSFPAFEIKTFPAVKMTGDMPCAQVNAAQIFL